MMPQVAVVRVLDRQGHRIRIWIPVLPVALLLSPVLVLVVLAIVVAGPVWRISPGRVLSTGWRLFCALRGTRIEVDQADAKVLVSIT
jgi:hypothetical protein